MPPRIIASLLALAVVLPSLLLAQPGTVEKIEVQGLFRMSREAFLHAFSVRTGDAYDPAILRRQLRRLWKLGLFEDISIEAEDGPQGGKVLVIKLKERPTLTAVTYDDAKGLTQTEIEDRLAERDSRPDLGKPIDMGMINSAEGAIRDLLAEKGFLDARVDAEVTRVAESTRAVHFTIDPGGKTRIREIEFTGNEVFSDGKLRKQLELTQERRWYWPWSQKNLYHPAKWDQDVAGIRQLYLANGYLDIEIRPPVVEVRDADAQQGMQPGAMSADAAVAAEPQVTEPVDVEPPADESGKKKKKKKKDRDADADAEGDDADSDPSKRWVVLIVPIHEGPQYTLGQIEFTGNEVWNDAVLRAQIPLKEGQILNEQTLEAGMERIRRLYEDRGHLYANARRQVQRHTDENVADIQVELIEDEPFYVARIEFLGNSKTHDKVLRRELVLAEGEIFSRSKLEISQVKVNQLGYYELTGEALIERIPNENRVNIAMVGEERGRNEIQIGGGYSGVDGAFFNGVYSTRNFLGRGQTVSLALQIGGRSSRYQISFQEPYFLNRPYRMGFTLFNRQSDFGASLRSTSRGIGVIFGKRVGRFANLNIGYNWQNVESQTVLLTAGGTAGTGVITTTNTVSSVTPVWTFNKINNPYRPSRGQSLNVSFQVAGGPLGGDTSFLKPIITYTGYRGWGGKSFFGVHAQGGWVRAWQGGIDVATASNIEGVPRFERFWLGGDVLGPRVFETRSITPVRYVFIDERNNILGATNDPTGGPADAFVAAGGVPVPVEIGGDRFFLVQSEWVYPVTQQAEFALFLDVGDALFEDQPFGFQTTRVSAGVEVRFHLPIFPVPLRLIYGWPVRKLVQDRTSNFTFSIGRSF